MSTPPSSANVAPGPVWAFLSPIGRMSREPYWLCFGLVLILTGILVNFWFGSNLDAFSVSLDTAGQTPETISPEFMRSEIAASMQQLQSNPVFLVSFFILELLPLPLMIKRLHDIGQSGFFALLVFVPIVGFVLFLYLGFADSQSEPNQHGPLPNSYWQ